MAEGKPSLLAGRNAAPLSSDEIKRVVNTFLGLDKNVNVRYEEGSRTVFRVGLDEQSGTQYGEIVFGPDIYPGGNIIDPNSALSIDGAAAHELTHFHRWKDKAALTDESLEHIDEALTSLEAICRYDRHLGESDKLQLACDAIQRLKLFLREQTKESASGSVPVAPSSVCETGSL
jgi:hypothetical protein